MSPEPRPHHDSYPINHAEPKRLRLAPGCEAVLDSLSEKSDFTEAIVERQMLARKERTPLGKEGVKLNQKGRRVAEDWQLNLLEDHNGNYRAVIEEVQGYQKTLAQARKQAAQDKRAEYLMVGSKLAIPVQEAKALERICQSVIGRCRYDAAQNLFTDIETEKVVRQIQGRGGREEVAQEVIAQYQKKTRDEPVPWAKLSASQMAKTAKELRDRSKEETFFGLANDEWAQAAEKTYEAEIEQATAANEVEIEKIVEAAVAEQTTPEPEILPPTSAAEPVLKTEPTPSKKGWLQKTIGYVGQKLQAGYQAATSTPKRRLITGSGLLGATVSCLCAAYGFNGSTLEAAPLATPTPTPIVIEAAAADVQINLQETEPLPTPTVVQITAPEKIAQTQVITDVNPELPPVVPEKPKVEKPPVKKPPTSKPTPKPSPTAAPTATPTPEPTPTPKPTEEKKEAKPLESSDFLANYLNPIRLADDMSGTPFVYSTYRVENRKDKQWEDVTYCDMIYKTGCDEWKFEDQNLSYYGYPLDGGGFGKYYTETGFDGQKEYVLLPPRQGPGVINNLWMAYENFHPLDASPQQKEWGAIENVGRVRFYFDGEKEPTIDVPVTDLFSGKAFPGTEKLGWKYEANGANGFYAPFAYAKEVKVTTTGVPRWLIIEGADLPPGSKVKTFDGKFAPNVLEKFNALNSDPALIPEANGYTKQQVVKEVVAENPLVINLQKEGTVAGLQFKIPKGAENDLWLQVTYGGEEKPAVLMPLKDFFTTSRYFKPHQSHLFGIQDKGDTYLFYSNLPLPVGKEGMQIIVSRNGSNPVNIQTSLFLSGHKSSSRLRAWSDPGTKLEVGSPNYEINLQAPKGGRVVAVFLDTYDFDKEHNADPGWVLNYMEGDVTATIDGRRRLIYTGIEDFFKGAYYFRMLWTAVTMKNPSIAGGILAFDGTTLDDATGVEMYRIFPESGGMAFKNNFNLSFGHGTTKNNGKVTYGGKVFYYTH